MAKDAVAPKPEIPSINSARAKSAPRDHWTISNRLLLKVGEEIELMRHRIRIVEMLRREDVYTECVVEVIGKCPPRDKEIIPDLRRLASAGVAFSRRALPPKH